MTTCWTYSGQPSQSNPATPPISPAIATHSPRSPFSAQPFGGSTSSRPRRSTSLRRPAASSTFIPIASSSPVIALHPPREPLVSHSALVRAGVFSKVPQKIEWVAGRKHLPALGLGRIGHDGYGSRLFEAN